MGTIIDKLTVVDTDGKIYLDLSKVPANLDPILKSQLQSLKYLIENGDKNMTPDQQVAHALLMRDRFVKAFRVFVAAQPDIKGLSLAGIKFAVIPGAFLLGPVFQDVGVVREAKVVRGTTKMADTQKQAEVLATYGLSWDASTRTLTRATANTKDIQLADALTWDAGKVVFPE
jgi:hypothetical protein